MESDLHDEIDLQILHALHLDARAPFAKIAAVIGISDQTVARRYARMRAAGSLHVWGQAEAVRLGRIEWQVRIRCTPDSTGEVAAALARRPETSWISRTSGGTEVVCIASSPTPADELLLKALPRSARVVDLSASALLHEFFSGGTSAVLAKRSALSPEQVAQLRLPAPQPIDVVTLDDVDQRILALLRADGRAPLNQIAAEVGVSHSTVQRRIGELRDSGVLTFDVDTERRRVGLPIRSMLWLTVAPADLDHTGAALAAHPEVAFAAAITGPRSLYAAIATHSVPAIYTYLSTSIATLPAVQNVESALVLHTVKSNTGPWR